jgi:hypothetical protein
MLNCGHPPASWQREVPDVVWNQMKSRLKNWVKRVSQRTGVLRWASQFSPTGAAILMYHSVQDEPELYANSIGMGIIHATKMFARQMELVSTRFSPVTINDIELFLNGRKPLPRRAVAITFDDGYADNLEIVAPILNEQSSMVLPATQCLHDGSQKRVAPPNERRALVLDYCPRAKCCAPRGLRPLRVLGRRQSRTKRPDHRARS